MRDCLELMGDIVAIHIFPDGQLDTSVPFNVMCPFISSTDIMLGSADVLTRELLRTKNGLAIDSYYNNVPEGSINIEPGVSIKETSAVSIQGVYYTTKVSAKTYEDIGYIRSRINNISENSFFDTIIVDSMEHVYLIRGSEPSTRISLSSVLPVNNAQTIDIEIVSVNGIIPVRF